MVAAARRTTQALTRLQAVIRAPDPADARVVRSGAVPDDLATGELRWLSLTEEEDAAVRSAADVIPLDVTLEHVRERALKALLWRFVCEAHIDRRTNHVRSFVSAHARQPEPRQIIFTVLHLDVREPFEVASTEFLPLGESTIPAHGDFASEPHVGGLARVVESGTDPGRIVERARRVAEHSIRIVRTGLRQVADDRQRRFRIGDRYAFSTSEVAGWRIADDAAWEIGMTAATGAQTAEQHVAGLTATPRNKLERHAHIALRWTDRATLATEPLVRVLFLFFALEALVGDRADEEKARRVAFRRAMLDHATRGGFRNPHITYWLYDEVRSAAVHGGEPLELTSRQVSGFDSDVHDAVEQMLEFGASIGATRHRQVLRALDTHPDVPDLVAWLRRTDRRRRWTDFTP
jgi:hypothetical protein